MPVQRMCKSCGRSIIVWSTVQTRCPKCQKARSKAKPPKPIRKVGKETLKYNAWRDTIAKPYLDKHYGHICAVRDCPMTDGLEVDHIKTRGARHDLKYDVKNVRYLCHIHHREVTDGKKLKFKR